MFGESKLSLDIICVSVNTGMFTITTYWSEQGWVLWKQSVNMKYQRCVHVQKASRTKTHWMSQGCTVLQREVWLAFNELAVGMCHRLETQPKGKVIHRNSAIPAMLEKISTKLCVFTVKRKLKCSGVEKFQCSMHCSLLLPTNYRGCYFCKQVVFCA